MKPALALMTILFTVALAPSADNWPSWRGPTADGIASADARPPLNWDTEKNIKWKAPLTGRGSATSIVWGDQVFIVTASNTGRDAKPEELPHRDPKLEVRTTAPKQFYKFEVISFDRTTGKEKWRQTAAEAVPHEGHHQTHSYAAGSPATDGKRLYVSFGSFGVYAYDLDGKLLWKRDLGRLTTRLGWGEAVTPVVHGGLLFLNWDQEQDSKLIALNAANGETKWETPRNERTTWNTPCVVEHNGVTQVIVNGTNRIRSYNAADGKLIWECGGMTVNPIPSVLVADGYAYALSGYNGAGAVAIPLDSKGDVTDSKTLRWRYGKGTPYVPSAVLHDGRLYFTSKNTNVLTILDAKTGQPKLADERLPGVIDFYASPVVADGRIYLVGRTGTTLVLKAGDKAEVLATNKLNDPIDASPVVCGKQIFLRGERYLYCIEEN
jgi:outer membrane protein assembly factor BamB